MVACELTLAIIKALPTGKEAKKAAVRGTSAPEGKHSSTQYIVESLKFK